MSFLVAEMTNALISYSMLQTTNRKIYGAKVVLTSTSVSKTILPRLEESVQFALSVFRIFVCKFAKSDSVL